MAALTSWHELHPDVPTSSIVSLQQDAGSSGDNNADSVLDQAAHAGLHGLGLPALYTAAPVIGVAALAWRAVADASLPAIEPESLLRPPKA